MDLKLDGKKAVVTGASKGIGRATAEALAAEGVTVYAAARSQSAGGPGVEPVLLDLTDPAAAGHLATVAGDVDILVNNLGGTNPESMRANGFLDIDLESWRATYDLNLFATVRLTQAMLPGLLRRRGIVINVSSIGARAAYPPVDYGTAKAALTNLTKALAEEFGPAGLRALTVSPGPTRTSNWSDAEGYAGELAAARGLDLDTFLDSVPRDMGITTGRLTEPGETAALITFLASPLSGNLTGADYLADGGAVKAV